MSADSDLLRLARQLAETRDPWALKRLVRAVERVLVPDNAQETERLNREKARLERGIVRIHSVRGHDLSQSLLKRRNRLREKLRSVCIELNAIRTDINSRRERSVRAANRLNARAQRRAAQCGSTTVSHPRRDQLLYAWQAVLADPRRSTERDRILDQIEERRTLRGGRMDAYLDQLRLVPKPRGPAPLTPVYATVSGEIVTDPQGNGLVIGHVASVDPTDPTHVTIAFDPPGRQSRPR